MKKLPILTLIIFSLASFQYSCNSTTADKNPYVVMLSLDGFRWDYTDKFDTPNFDRLATEGILFNKTGYWAVVVS